MKTPITHRSPAPAAPPPPEPRHVWQWVVLAALVAAGVASWAMFYFDFAMPNPDFTGFREMARAIYTGTPPDTWKRMPAYPLAIGAVAAVLPLSLPYVHAGLIVNFAFSVGSLIFLYLLAHRLIGRAALVVVAALIVTPYFSLMVAQPLLEPLLGFCLILGLYLMSRGSGWAYAVGSYASLSRYEGALLIPVKWGLDMSTSPRRWARHTLMAALATLPLVLWTAFTTWAARGEGGNAYADEISGIAKLAWVKVPLMFTPWAPLGESRPIDLYPVLALAAVGLAVSLRRFPRMSLAILATFAGYTAVHIVFPVYRPRYAYPVLWVMPFYAVTGGDFLARLLWPRLRKHRVLSITLSATACVVAALWLVNGTADFGMIRNLKPWQSRPQYLLLPLVGVAALIAFSLLAVRERWVTRAALGLCLAALLYVPSLRGAEVRAREQGYFRHENIQYRLAADWLTDHLKPGEKATIPTGKFKFFQDRPPLDDAVINAPDLASRTSDAFVEELRRRGITYVVMTSMLTLPADEGHPNYARDLYWYHSMNSTPFEPFRGGRPVPGFDLIATLDVPADMVIQVEPVYIYRLQPDTPHVAPPQ